MQQHRHPTTTITWSTPDLRTLTPRALEIWTEAEHMGYRRGYEDGCRDTEARHWNLPPISTAVQSLKALGEVGINRRERARRDDA